MNIIMCHGMAEPVFKSAPSGQSLRNVQICNPNLAYPQASCACPVIKLQMKQSCNYLNTHVRTHARTHLILLRCPCMYNTLQPSGLNGIGCMDGKDGG